MLTIDYAILQVAGGHRVLDIGCGGGRHSYASLERGAHVVAADLDEVALSGVRDLGAAMLVEGHAPVTASLVTVRADALRLPFADGSFDRVVASEVMEHIVDDGLVLRELQRVTRPGGLVGVTVPRRWPERICWLLSDQYHSAAGGHVRIYRRDELESKLERAGLQPFDRHHAHALHSPYWWLKCAVGIDRKTRLVAAYHSMLVWDIVKKPAVTRWLERLLNPVMGKSLVVYARKT